MTSGVDSRTILDMNAPKLLGKGRHAVQPAGNSKPVRVQGAFVSDEEVSAVVRVYQGTEWSGDLHSAEMEEAEQHGIRQHHRSDRFQRGCRGRQGRLFCRWRAFSWKEKGSIGMLQRYFKIGFNRAARIMDQLEEAGIVGPEEGTKPRRVLMSPVSSLKQYEEEYL